MKINDKKIYRIIDANLNRSREGLRVCEEVLRFVFDDALLSARFKRARHKIAAIIKDLDLNSDLLCVSRNTKEDVGRPTQATEKERRDVKDIFAANIQRVKESVRVLEEFFKIIDHGCSQSFKTLRFRIYNLEKKTYERFTALRNN
ncbi:MAG: thiamine-phosphate pyrophosphorylase [Candidatus Omnitrophica bacterium]|nr:thiamine-phosphate pyrophosphorylase [Candidatus Omnitrophota bacterium]